MSVSFELTDEQAELRRVVAQFAADKVAPRAEEMNARGELPDDLLDEMAAMGLFGLALPAEYDGMGGDLLSLCLAVEEIGRVDQSLGVTLDVGAGLGARPIEALGTDEQRARWLPHLARGEWLGSFGLTEPGGGSDTQSMRTTAVRDGDSWVLNGSKQFITNAGTQRSGLVTVAAVTDRRDGRAEITNFVVPTDTRGYSVGAGYRKVGWHASDTRDLYFDDCRIPAANQLGDRGRGLSNFLGVLNEGRVAFAALATGLIQGCVDESVEYAQQREAFGKPIGAYQAIAGKVADMEAAAETARAAYYRAAALADADQPFHKAAAVAKLHATESAVESARQACQVFGGYGFTTEYPVGRFYQDAKVLEIGEGTSEVQRLLIARDLGLPTS
jgi:alkylation response protein AidB-like acyl-CoA dehydrogenase